MRTVDHYLLPLALLALGAVGAVIADRVARFRRRPEGDGGDFWAGAVQRVCLVLGLSLLASEAMAIVPGLWRTGRHLEFDLTGIAGWSFAACYRLALLLPFLIWAALLSFGLVERPRGRDAGRWLAGAIGFSNSRLWVLVWTLPLAALMVATLSDLGGGPGAYPAAAWGTMAVLLLSLVGVALSAGQIPAIVARHVVVTAHAERELQPWPAALAGHGVKLRHVTSWAASEPCRPVRRSAAHLAERLRLRGANGIAPELIEVVDDLFGSGDDDRARLVFAPDDCGQAEAIALAAELLDQRFHATTLVVTASGAQELAAELTKWLPAGRRVVTIEPSLQIDADVLIVVTDAQTLSDRLLPQLKDPLMVKRFGLIVWWHLEAYTGVLAANLWAISRRLHRLLQATGRQDVRTLALVRGAPHPEAQLGAFVERLLPHPFKPQSEVVIHPRYSRDIHLHVLEGHENYFARGEGRDVQEKYRHLPLVAARVSVEEGWSTYLELPSDLADPEEEAFLRLSASGAALGGQLQRNGTTAGARIKKIEAGEALSLPEIIGQGGRAMGNGLPHHVGVTLPSNPYVAHILAKLQQDASAPASRRLVSAAAQPTVIKRHLLLALDELPDTRSALLKDFLWNERIIDETLDQISREGRLTRKEVRFLDASGKLQPEYEYKSQHLPDSERRPLDTVGISLIDVHDVTRGHESEGGIKMRVDPERLTIQAYPNRVFLSGGRRYRIHGWDSIDKIMRERRLECEIEERYSSTWRIHTSHVFRLEPLSATVGVGRRSLLARATVALTYEDEVVGALRLAPNLTSGAVSEPQTLPFRPITQRFDTRALLLRFPEEQDAIALASLAQALRHVLPVHLGVEEEALEVVPLTGDATVRRERAFGLAVVDLYPGGIGVVDAISDDGSFVVDMFHWAADWLAACDCNSDQGCARCLRSPAALAANADRPPLRKAALELLRKVV